jgi:hypothetical protein
MLFVAKTDATFSSFNESYGTTRPTTTSFGTSLTPSIVSLAAATWTQLIAPVAKDSCKVLININNNNLSAASINTVVDIGIDPAGGTSYTTIIPALLCGGASTYTGVTGCGVSYLFPIAIPAGASVAARGYSTVVTAFSLYAYLYSEPISAMDIPIGSYVKDFAITGNVGVAITVGTTSEGAWTSLGTTDTTYWGIEYGVQIDATDISWNVSGLHVDIAVGDATTKDIIISNSPVTYDSSERLMKPLRGLVTYPIPSGTNIYARLQSSGGADTTSLAVYLTGG